MMSLRVVKKLTTQITVGSTAYNFFRFQNLLKCPLMANLNIYVCCILQVPK